MKVLGNEGVRVQLRGCELEEFAELQIKGELL